MMADREPDQRTKDPEWEPVIGVCIGAGLAVLVGIFLGNDSPGLGVCVAAGSAIGAAIGQCFT